MDTKICSKCGRELPSTKEYFFKDKSYSDGYESQCKECQGYVFGIQKNHIGSEVVNGKKYCTKCERLLDVEHFPKSSKNKSGYYSFCKDCRKQFYEKNKEAIAKKHKEYYENNKEAVLASQQKYFEKNKEKIIAYRENWRCENSEYKKQLDKEYREQHKEEYKQYKKQYYEQNREEILEKSRFYSKTNRPTINQFRQKYRELNRNYFRTYNQARRTKKKNLLSMLSIEDWEECLAYFDHKDAYTGLPMEIISQDHVIPLSKGGGYVKQNIVPCEKSINSSKNNSDMETWFRQQPFFDEGRLQKIYAWIGMKENVQQISIL